MLLFDICTNRLNNNKKCDISDDWNYTVSQKKRAKFETV